MFFVSHAIIFLFSTQMKIFLLRPQSLRNDKFFYVTMWHRKYTHYIPVHYSKGNKTTTNHLNVYLDAYDVTESASKQRYIPSNPTIGSEYEVHSSEIKVNYGKLYFLKEFMSLRVCFSNKKIRNQKYEYLRKI